MIQAGPILGLPLTLLVGFSPRTPTPGPIKFRLRHGDFYPVLADSDGVGFGLPPP